MAFETTENHVVPLDSITTISELKRGCPVMGIICVDNIFINCR